jgi:hypothetical protein
MNLSQMTTPEENGLAAILTKIQAGEICVADRHTPFSFTGKREF